MSLRLLLTACLSVLLATPLLWAQRQTEQLDRGLVGVVTAKDEVFLSWRLLASDAEAVAFNVYRIRGDEQPVKLNSEPITQATCFVDRGVNLDQAVSYRVAVHKATSDTTFAAAQFTLAAGAKVQPYLSVPLQTPAGYQPNDASVGDLDGDGDYEIVLHQAGRGRDNSQAGATDPPILEAYDLKGTLLWRIQLGKNIREGAHYTQFMVYDFDGDGRAEVACKTADGTIDGQGKAIGDAAADHRNERGYILSGPEYLTIFDGRTGAALATTEYLPQRGSVASWGDDYGNRVDRFLACVAYLDGERPSLVMCRGYYTRMVLVAWNWRDGSLQRVWTFDTDDADLDARDYRGQGNHNLSVGDVDEDGRDEVIYGACCIDDNGRGLYSTRLGHGDALHLSDLDPARPGLEVLDIHEHPRHEHGLEMHDARTGKILWSVPSPDAVRGVAIDLDPRHPGYECWAAGSGLGGLFDCRGKQISISKPRSCNMGIWWDGDLLRETLSGVAIAKWDYERERETRLFSGRDYHCVANNGSKANPCLCADILGDWREELIARTSDGKELRIFTTTIPTEHRLTTLMHDPIYRLGVAWQNVGYNQPAHTSYYLGEGMTAPKRPALRFTPRKTE